MKKNNASLSRNKDGQLTLTETDTSLSKNNDVQLTLTESNASFNKNKDIQFVLPGQVSKCGVIKTNVLGFVKIKA